MARKLVILLGLIFLMSLTARAQDKGEWFGGYSYERFRTSPSRNLNGWEISGQYKFAAWLGGIADVGAHYSSQIRTVSLMVGPQVSFPAGISPFFHVRIGRDKPIRAGGISDISFSPALGGGIDMLLAPGISWRVIQADDAVTCFFGGTQNDARISSGIVIRF
jgi:hypothetical protein